MRLKKHILIASLLVYSAGYSSSAQTTEPAFNVDAAMEQIHEVGQNDFRNEAGAKANALWAQLNTDSASYASSHPIVVKDRADFVAAFELARQWAEKNIELGNSTVSFLPKQIDRLKADLRNTLGDLAGDAIQPLSRSLAEQRETLRLESAGAEARMLAIEQEIKETKDRTAQKARARSDSNSAAKAA